MRANCSPTIGPRRTIIGLRDQCEVCIHGEETLGTSLRDMFAPARGSKRSDATGRRGHKLRPLLKRREGSTCRTIGGDSRVQWIAAPPACGVLPSQTRQLSILVNGRGLCRPQFSNCRAQTLCTVGTGHPSYRSGSKGVKFVVLGQKAEFSPTTEKKGLVLMQYQQRCFDCAGNRFMSMHHGVMVGCQTPFCRWRPVQPSPLG